MTSGICFTGAFGNADRTPDKPAFHITGPMTLIVRKLGNFRVKGEDQGLAARWFGASPSWIFDVDVNDNIRFVRFADGANRIMNLGHISETDGWTWVGITFRPNAGGVSRGDAFRSMDGKIWQRFGFTTQINTTPPLYVDDIPMTIGGRSQPSPAQNLDACLASVELRNGVGPDGTPGGFRVFYRDYTQQSTPWLDPQGNTWTLMGSDWKWQPSKGFTPSASDILDLQTVRVRSDAFRFELCDRDLRPIGELHPDRSASVPTIENDTSNSTLRRLRNFKLLPGEAQDVDLFGDRLKVYMVLQNGDEFSLGAFLWGDANNPVRSWGQEQHSDLVDYGYILDQSTTRVFSFGRKADIFNRILFLLDRANIPLLPGSIIGDEAHRLLSEPMSWEPGTSWLQILTDLGHLVGFGSPWFDRNGSIHFDQLPDPALAPPTVSYDTHPRMVADSITISDDTISAPNSFAVFDSGTDKIRVGRAGLPASAPHSFAHRGFRTGLVESVQGIESQAQADLAARNLRLTESVAFQWLSFTSPADPRHDTYDIVEAFGVNWLETAWSLELRSGGAMQHTLRRTSFELGDLNASV